MKIAFTICSNNYLAQAKALGDSIVALNPDYKFYIGLVDRLSPEIDYKKDIQHEVLTVEDLNYQQFDSLWKKYDIIELNTCVKPMYFKYFFNKYNADHILYLDPDTMVINSLSELANEFDAESAVLLTPHIFKPIPIDGKSPFENTFLNYGIYNLGFLGLKNEAVSFELLNWWEERTVKYGHSKAEFGFFVDQLWFNLAPLFFSKVKILQSPGYNMAPWNLHERELGIESGKYKVNQTNNLVFYHFSNYKYTHPAIIANHYNRFKLQDQPALKQLYDTYLKLIIANNVQQYSGIACYFVTAKNAYDKQLEITNHQKYVDGLSKKGLIIYYIKKAVPPVFRRMYKAI